MKSLQRKSQVHTRFLVIVLVMLVWIQAATAQLSLSTPTDGVQCYGDPVTLLCTHTVLPQEPKYPQADVTWRRDGTAISTLLLGQIKPNPTTTRLQFTIDENTTGNYTCFLVNAIQGGTDESNRVSVRPLDLTPPVVTNIDPFESNITVEWTPQHCAVRYNVSWNYTNDDGTTTTGSGVSDQVTNYTIPTSVQGVYTVSVQAVDGVGNVGPATSEVVRSTYPRPTANATPCEDRLLLLKCLASGQHTDRRSHFMWIDRNSNLTNSTLYTITGPELMIANVSALSVEEDKAIRCCEVLNNGIIVEGVEYKVEPLAQPGPPEVTITTTDSTITLTWNTTLRCFESEMFTFVVIWNEIGSGTSTNVTTSSSPYTISGLQPGTSYQISVQGVGGSGVVGGTAVLSVSTPAETPIGGGDPTTAVATAVVVSVIFLAAVVTAIVIVVALCRKTRVRGDYDTGSSPHDPDPPASSNPFSGRLSGTCCYTTVDFKSGHTTPIPPPPVEGVTYAEPVAVGEKESQTHYGETKPEFPTKQQPHHNNVVHDDKANPVPDSTKDLSISNQYTILQDQNVSSKVADNDSENEDLQTSEQVVDSSPMIQPMCPPPPKTSPPPDYQGGYSGVTSDDSKIYNDPFRSPPGDIIVSAQNSVNMASLIHSFLVSPFECKLSDEEEEVLHKRVPQEELMEEEAVQETTLTACPPPSTAASIANLEYPEEPLPTAASVGSGEYPEPLPIVFTEFFREYPDVLKADDSDINPEQTSVSEDLQTSEQVVDSSPMVLSKCPPPPTATPPPDYQGGSSGVTSDDSKTHDVRFRSPQECTMTIVSGQYSMYMPSITSGFLVSSFEHKLSDDEEEVFHKRVPQEEVEEEEAMPVPVQETPLTTHSLVPPLTAASIANSECLEEPLRILTATSVASKKDPESLPMDLTEFSDEYPDVLKADDSNISLEPDSVDSIIVRKTDLPPVNQTPTEYSGKTYGFLGGLETALDPSQHQQNWRLWTSKKTESFEYASTVNESVQHMRVRNYMTYNEKGKLCCRFCTGQLTSSRQLFPTVKHCWWCDQG